jgi:hypothetical protein
MNASVFITHLDSAKDIMSSRSQTNNKFYLSIYLHAKKIIAQIVITLAQALNPNDPEYLTTPADTNVKEEHKLPKYTQQSSFAVINTK